MKISRKHSYIDKMETETILILLPMNNPKCSIGWQTGRRMFFILFGKRRKEKKSGDKDSIEI